MKLIKGIYKFFDKKIIVPITKFFVNIGEKIKNIGKPLEMVSKSKKGIIIISLILAVAICYYIQGRSNSLLETNAKVLYDQPVVANYNENKPSQGLYPQYRTYSFASFKNGGMKIAILNGSPKTANTASMVKAFAEGAEIRELAAGL